tara:strand:+ start:631 stop:1968 length:1338 start_codon:yes stop_codon:yes gene_type:complete
MFKDTIFALSTPPGTSGISVVRISGTKAFTIIDCLTKSSINLKLIKYAQTVHIYHKDDRVLDKVVVVLYKKPKSYTGLNLVEISCHGNPLIVESIYQALYSMEARIANPGEFTFLAFKNNKLDLLQAEAVGSLIHSASVRSLELNNQIINGRLSKQLNSMRSSLINSASLIEFELDISEMDALNTNTISTISKSIDRSIKDCSRLISSYSQNKIFLNGARVAVVGSPNVGKSTLLNSILNSDRAIVSDIPGTTRDTIEATVYINNVMFIFVDTAGMRKSSDLIENIGISKSQIEIDKSDLVLHLFDSIKDSDFKYISKNKNKISVLNKIDLFKKNDYKNIGDFQISAKNNIAIQNLLQAIYSAIIVKPNPQNSTSLTSLRQLQCIEECSRYLLECQKMVNKKNTTNLELIAVEIKSAIKSLDSILGNVSTADIINNIFVGFCVGK